MERWRDVELDGEICCEINALIRNLLDCPCRQNNTEAPVNTCTKEINNMFILRGAAGLVERK